MSNISTYLNKISSAIYGKEVRSSIHDAIEAINEQVDELDDNATERISACENTCSQALQMAEDSAGGGIVLWSGAAFPGASVEFSIPEKCFHHNSTTLTLMIESYTAYSGNYAPIGNKPIFVTLVLGTLTEMIGSTYGTSYEPYTNEYGYSVNDMTTNIHINDTLSDTIKASVKAKKTVDSRYALGIFSVSSESDEDVIFTSISAIISKDMEENEE